MQIKREAPSLEQARPIAAAAFGRPDDERNRNGVQAVLSEGVGYCAYVDTELIGFACFMVLDDILYLNAIAVIPSQQRSGAAQSLIDAASTAFNLPFLGWRTQSLRAHRAFSKRAARVYPHISYEDTDCLIRARRLAEHDGHSSTLAKGVYGGPLFGEKPTVTDANIQVWWDSICSFENGDAVYCVARLQEKVMIKIEPVPNPLARKFTSERLLFPTESARFSTHVSRPMVESNKSWENRLQSMPPGVRELSIAIFGTTQYITHIFFYQSYVLCVIGTRPEWDTLRPHWEWGEVEDIHKPDWAWDEDIERAVIQILEAHLASSQDAA